jgi:hypothetical protein
MSQKRRQWNLRAVFSAKYIKQNRIW